MKQNFDAIIFDLGGVVLNLSYTKTIDAFKKLGKENFEQLYTQAQQDQIFDKYEIGVMSSQEFRDYMNSFLPNNVENKIIDDAWNAMLIDLPKARIELLYRLKQEYRIFLFSNTNDIHLNAFKKIIFDAYGDTNLLESIFHQTYYSHLVGYRKPMAEAFQIVLDNHKLNPARTLFIDDSAQHIEGAQKLGIQTIHLVNQDICDLPEFRKI